MKRILALASLVVFAGAVGAGLGANSVHPTAIPPSVAFARPSYAERMLLGGAQQASAAALPVEVEVTALSINNSANSYTETVSLCVSPCSPADTSGLSSFSESWTGSGTTPRYTIGSVASISLP